MKKSINYDASTHTTSTDPIDEFLKLCQKVPKFSDKEIKEAINKGRE